MVSTKILAVLCLVTFVGAQQTAHVFLVIGQSNSVGTNFEGLTSEDTTDPRILQTSCCHNGTADNNDCSIILAQDPLAHQCDNFYVQGQSVGFAMTFARQLLLEIPVNDLIVLVPAAIGGTGFWDNVWTAYNGTGFSQALLRLQSTFKNLVLNYPLVVSSFDGILWHQGEADNYQDVNHYIFHDLIPMVEAWRNTTLIPQTDTKVPFVAGNLLPSWLAEENPDNRRNISAGIMILPQLLSNSATAPSLGLTKGAIDNIHFSAPSQRNFGRRYFAAWKQAQTNEAVPSL